MHSLPIFVRLAGAPVIVIGTGEAAQAKRRLIERAGGLPVGRDDARADEARLAFVALEDGAAAETAAADLKARGLFVNVVDRPELCNFTTPAIVDRDPVLVAIGTGGASSGLAAALRQRLEDVLPTALGQLARGLQAARAAMRQRWPDGGERRRALSQALAPGGLLDPFGDTPDVAEWLESGHGAALAEIHCVSVSSPDPDLLTVRDARALGRADRIVHPSGTPPAILARARADAVRLELSPDTRAPDALGLTVLIRLDMPEP
ncbi:MAG: siroheme synthase [Sphingobium sp. 66-54]|nr:MAG: siroheme synthase [Sphingobium sp. 66-54]